MGVETREEKPRQRHGMAGMSSNIQRLFHKRSVLSQRTTSTFDGHFAHGKPGWWTKQMLVDRSLRSMAGFTTVCAFIMLIILLSYIPDFVHRLNPHSTSVGGKSGESCGQMETRNVVCLVWIEFVVLTWLIN